MKVKHFSLAVVLVLSVSCAAFADRELDRQEILQIFQQLTEQPRKTWIPAGTIEASREEYRAPKITDLSEIANQLNEKIAEYQNDSDKGELTETLQKMKLDAIPFNVRYELLNESTMSSTATVRFDGDRFYWEINVSSRTDSMKPGPELAGNFMTDQFDISRNDKRIFVWDGEKYSTYSPSGNHAIVDSTGSMPHVVNGPLTAGIIPWGYGYYAYNNLIAAESSAVEKYIDGQQQIHLTLNNSNGSQMLFVLEPGKDYAVISCTMSGLGNVVVSKQYSNYQSAAGDWVPFNISIERYDEASNRLLTSDLWVITSIDTEIPEADSFQIGYEPDSLIEYISVITNKPAMYRHSEMVDTGELLSERLAFAANQGSQSQNCATAVLKYVASKLGKEVTDSQLSGLVGGPNNETSLYAMKEFAEELGLYCRAVKTDIDTLKNLNGCEAILHIPGKNHFVVLSSVDNEYVRIIDLTSNKFYYRTDISFFDMDWTEGTALLISNSAITGELTEIDDVQLGTIVGAGGYSCSRILQQYNAVYCEYIGEQCDGDYKIYWERWGCQSAQSGSCSSSVSERYRKSPCIEDPWDPFNCIITGEWTFYYMRACA